jgi:hypothetical protein
MGCYQPVSTIQALNWARKHCAAVTFCFDGDVIAERNQRYDGDTQFYGEGDTLVTAVCAANRDAWEKGWDLSARIGCMGRRRRREDRYRMGSVRHHHGAQRRRDSVGPVLGRRSSVRGAATMSVDRNLYIGPYVRCTRRNETETYTEHGCPVHAPDHNSPGPYCRKCGAMFVDTIRVRPKHISSYEVVGDELHGYEDEGTLYLFENGTKKGAPEYGLDEHEQSSVDFADMLPSRDRDWFVSAFAAELAKLREVYDDVEVRWGVHRWFS